MKEYDNENISMVILERKYFDCELDEVFKDYDGIKIIFATPKNNNSKPNSKLNKALHLLGEM